MLKPWVTKDFVTRVHASFDLNVEGVDDELLCHTSSINTDMFENVVDDEALVVDDDAEVDLNAEVVGDELHSHTSSLNTDAFENVMKDETLDVEDDYAEVANVNGVLRARSNKDLSLQQHKLIYEALLQRSVNGKLKHGTTIGVASMFNVSARTVQRIWKQARDSIRCGAILDFSCRRYKNCGRKRIFINSN